MTLGPAMVQIPTPNEAEFRSYYLIMTAGRFGRMTKRPHETLKQLKNAPQEVLVSLIVVV